MSRGFKAACGYRFRDSLRGTCIFGGVLLAISLLSKVLEAFRFEVFVNGVSAGGLSFMFASRIFVFVVGICAVREDLRLFLQNGVGRRTLFAVEFLHTILLPIACAVLCVLCDLILSIPGLREPAVSADVFTGDYFAALGIGTAAMVLAMTLGMFISLSFYRMNRAWTIVCAVGVPVVGINAAAWLLSRLMARPWLLMARPWFETFVMNFIQSPMRMSGTFLGLAAVFLACVWLLLRRAPVKVTGK